MQFIPTRAGRVAVHIAGEGPALVLLHAAAHDHRDFDDVVPELAKRFRTIALDWPGHGASDMIEPPASASAALMGDALEDVAVALGLEDAIFLGNSVGGTASMRLAIRRPELVRALVLVDTSGLIPRTRLLRAICWIQGREFVRRWTGLAFTRSYLKRRNAHVDAAIARVSAAHSKPGFIAMYAAMWRSFASPEADMAEAARKIACPTLVIWGKQDPVLRANVEGKRVRTVLPHAKYVELDTGHVPFVEDPSGFLDVVLPFLAAVPSSAEATRSAQRDGSSPIRSA